MSSSSIENKNKGWEIKCNKFNCYCFPKFWTLILKPRVKVILMDTAIIPMKNLTDLVYYYSLVDCYSRAYSWLCTEMPLLVLGNKPGLLACKESYVTLVLSLQPWKKFPLKYLAFCSVPSFLMIESIRNFH